MLRERWIVLRRRSSFEISLRGKFRATTRFLLPSTFQCKITYLQMKHDPRLRVLEHEQAVLRGLRIGPDIDLAEAALQREREVQFEIDKRAQELRTSADLFDATHDDEELPMAASFSQAKGEKEEGK